MFFGLDNFYDFTICAITTIILVVNFLLFSYKNIFFNDFSGQFNYFNCFDSNVDNNFNYYNNDNDNNVRMNFQFMFLFFYQ